MIVLIYLLCVVCSLSRHLVRCRPIGRRCGLRLIVGGLRAVHDVLVLLCGFIVFLHLGVFLELVCSAAHDILYPCIQHRNIVFVHADGDEDVRPEHIVHVVSNKCSDELVHPAVDVCILGSQSGIDHVHVTSVHDGLVMLMDKVTALVHQTGELLTKLSELVVEGGCPSRSLVCCQS